MAANATGSTHRKRTFLHPLVKAVRRPWQAWVTPRSTQRDLAFRERSIRAMIFLEGVLLVVIISLILILPNIDNTRAVIWLVMLAVTMAAGLAVTRGHIDLSGMLLISVFIAAVPITVLRNGYWSGTVIFAIMLAFPTCALLLSRRQAAIAACLIILIYLILIAWESSRGVTPATLPGPDPLVTPIAAAVLLTTGFVIIILTGRHMLHEFDERLADLMAANQRLRELDHLKDQFINSVSHELRTPITNLKIYHSLLQANSHKRDSYLETLNQETGRLEQIVERTLIITQMVKDIQGASFHPVDIGQLMEQAVTRWQPNAASHGIVLRHQLASGLPLVTGNSMLLDHMLGILLDNAVKYTRADGEATISTQLEHDNDNDWVVIRVENTGYSITPDEVPHLFTRFFRGRSSLDARVPGAGVGLFIAAEIVRRHGGVIQFENRQALEQAGAVIAVRLPAAGKMD